MAKVWFVMVLLIAQNVFAEDDEDPRSQSCDLCISSGKTWCLLNTKYQGHCITVTGDATCPGGNEERLATIIVNPKSDDNRMYERTLYMSNYKHQKLPVPYKSDKNEKRNVTISFLDTTDPKIDVKEDTDIDTVCEPTDSDYLCTAIILAKPQSDFCSTGRDFVDVKLKFDGSSEEVTIRYHVICSCRCSKLTFHNAKQCNYRGNYTCGRCSCESEWTGDSCEIKEGECSRGDIQQDLCATERGDELVECYGNGKCVCGKCKCFEDREGSQYFDQSDMCADVCIQTMHCHTCLFNGTLGNCNCDHRNLTLLPLNETIATTEKDEKNRNKWVQCKEQKHECTLHYYAMRNKDNYYAMMKSNCSITAAKLGVLPSGSKVTIIIGILGIIAVIATVAGIMLWKHKTALPDCPASAPQYSNIDAEDCTGVNPIYQPPVTSFKNPTYGKW